MADETKHRSWFKRFGYQFLRILLWFAFKVCYRYHIEGREHFPMTGPGLICANHQSHLDPMLVGTTCTRRMNFLAKKQLFRYPPLNWIISFLDSIPIDREGVSSASGIKETLKCLKRGELVLMFPEGARTFDGKMQPIMPGFCALVKRTKVPLIPVGVSGAFRAWPRTRRFPIIGPKIRVIIGEPILPNEYENLAERQIIELLDQRMQAVFANALNAAS